MPQVQGFPYDFEPDPNKTVVRTAEQFEHMVRVLDDAKQLIFDHETSGLAWYNSSQSCGLALGCFAGDGKTVQAWYTPYRHDTCENQFDIARIGPAIKRLLEKPNTIKIAHNIKFDEHMSRREGWRIVGPRYCTMVAARVHDENHDAKLKTRAFTDLGDPRAKLWESHLGHTVQRLSKRYNATLTDYRSVFGYSQVPIELCGRYACYDIDYTARLWRFYEDTHHLTEQFPRIMGNEMELTEVLCDVEENGLLIDVEYLEDLKERVTREREQVEDLIWKAFPHTSHFPIAKNAKLLDFLHTIPVTLTKTTKSGDLCVDDEVLEQCAREVPACDLFRRWRKLNKLATTYTDSILTKVDARGFLHGDYQQLGTETGRMSCINPNLQNLAKDSDERAKDATGRGLKQGGIDPYSIRRAFINRSREYVRIYADYSQAELRVLAAITGDPIMIDSFAKDEDIHLRTTAEVLGAPDPSKRDLAKRVNFGLVYGLSPGGLSRQVGCSVQEAQGFFAAYFARYVRVPEFRQQFWSACKYNGGVFFNLWGRRRVVANLDSKDERARRSAEREAFAALIQGTASELTKESMIRVHRYIKQNNLNAKLVNSIHDELQFDVHYECLVKVVPPVKRMMCDYPEIAPVRARADFAYSNHHWAEKKALAA